MSENFSDPKSVGRLVNTVMAARILGCQPHTLAVKRCRGGGPAFIKTGGSVRYHSQDLQDFIDKNRRRSTSETA
jgi:hypothetical protein